MRFLNSRDDNFARQFADLLAEDRDAGRDVSGDVATIIRDVVARGDEAVHELTRRFDGRTLESPCGRVSMAERDAAAARVDSDDRAAMQLAYDRITAFHERQMPNNIHHVEDSGIVTGMRWRAIDNVGLYVPGGTAAYPSSVLMNAIPARVAGCKRLVVTAPCPGGDLHPHVMHAAEMLGIEEIYSIGGAQAIAALAHGTGTIAPVDKITGPGNAWVAEAKRQMFGKVGIDMVAGPSEILVIADGSQNPSWIAADLLSQAEHDESAQSLLMTDDIDFARKVCAEVERFLDILPRAAIARRSWEHYGAVIVVSDINSEAPALADDIAAEHLQIITQDPDPLLESINHAGSIFVGPWTPEVIGDYVGGPNHVLPTLRSARFSSGLSVHDFLKRSTILRCDAQSFAPLAAAASRLARAEGLQAHALAVDLRLAANDRED